MWRRKIPRGRWYLHRLSVLSYLKLFVLKNGSCLKYRARERMSNQCFRKELKNILSEMVLLEGISEKKMREKLRPLRDHIDSHLPSRLFRYRACSEMNIDAKSFNYSIKAGKLCSEEKTGE